MSNKVYMLQVSNGEDPKLLSKIITTRLCKTCLGAQLSIEWQSLKSNVSHSQVS